MEDYKGQYDFEEKLYKVWYIFAIIWFFFIFVPLIVLPIRCGIYFLYLLPIWLFVGVIWIFIFFIKED